MSPVKRAAVALLAAVTVVCLPAIALLSQEDPLAELLAQSQELIRQQRFPQALQLLDQAKQSSVDDARPYFYSGLALMEAGRLRQAGPELREAIKLDPQRPEYSLLYAEVLSRLGLSLSANEALESFEDRTRLEQLSNRELWLLVDLYHRLNAHERALSVLERFRENAPSDPRVALREAQLLMAAARFEEAVESFQKALPLTDAKAPVFYGLGVARWKLGLTEEAERDLTEALRLDGDQPEYSYQLALVRIDLDDPQGAVDLLLKIEAIGDRYPPVYNALARAYRRLGDDTRSRQYAARFQQSQARQFSRESREQLAQTSLQQAIDHLQNGRVATAEKLLLDSLRENPENWIAHKYLVRIYLDSGRWQPAAAHLEQFQRIEPENYSFQLLSAEYWYRQRQPKVALGFAEKARQMRPGDAEMRNLLGNIYLQLGQRELALQEYQAAVRLAPDRQDFRLNLQSLAKP